MLNAALAVRPGVVLPARRPVAACTARTSLALDRTCNPLRSVVARPSTIKPQQCTPRVVAASRPSGGAGRALPTETSPEPFKWGAKMKELGIAVGLGVALWFVPPPAGVTAQAWHLLSIFIATIVGIITQPLPLGAVAMLGLGATMLTKTLTFAQAFSAFANEIPYESASMLHNRWLHTLRFTGGSLPSPFGCRAALSARASAAASPMASSPSLARPPSA